MTQPKNSGQFGLGNPGKPKGAKNKDAALIRDMVATALSQAGGVDYLARIAESHPAPFLGLVGKVLPIQVTGKDGDSLKLELTGLAWLQQSIQARNSTA